MTSLKVEEMLISLPEDFRQQLATLHGKSKEEILEIVENLPFGERVAYIDACIVKNTSGCRSYHTFRVRETGLKLIEACHREVSLQPI